MLNQIKIVVCSHKLQLCYPLSYLNIRHIGYLWHVHQSRVGTGNTLEIVVPKLVENIMIGVHRWQIFVEGVFIASVSTFPSHIGAIFGQTIVGFHVSTGCTVTALIPSSCVPSHVLVNTGNG